MYYVLLFEKIESDSKESYCDLYSNNISVYMFLCGKKRVHKMKLLVLTSILLSPDKTEDDN